MKTGSAETISVSVQSEGAVKDLEVECSNSYVATAGLLDASTVKVIAGSRSTTPLTVTISSAYNKKASQSFKLYIYDYEASDMKKGDYVYSNGSSFRWEDCGLRYADAMTAVYQDASGSRTTKPKPYPGETLSGGWKYVGVVVDRVSETGQFLCCHYLNDCKDGSKAEGLYGYRSFTMNSLGGFSNSSSGSHALVVRKDQTASKVEWQHNNEFVSDCKAKHNASGLYQFQLQSRYAFSPEACTYLNEGWSSNNCKYCASGFMPYLLLKFYGDHVNDSNYRFIPATVIEGYTDVPKLSAGKGTTGWYLPGEWEWGKIRTNLDIVNNSLSESGGSRIFGDYWSPEEKDEYQAYCYRFTITDKSRVFLYKDTRTHDNGSAYTRAVLLL